VEPRLEKIARAKIQGFEFLPGRFSFPLSNFKQITMEERDHRQLGKELDLFSFSELVGPGLPLWTPKGTILRHEIDKFIWQLREERGYQRVTIPHITKKDLYETSGHWEKLS